MNQPELINTQPMTLARVMERFQRARYVEDLGSRSRSSPKTHDSNTTAKSAAAPASSQTPWRERSQEMQFHLPDEDRRFPLKGLARCWLCYHLPKLDKAQSVFETWYRVSCSNPNCHNTTPPCRSSKAAVQIWQVTAALSRE